jgi:SAM-dependent methyltransferase
MQETLAGEYVQQARELLSVGIARYGLPTSGPVYDGNLRALIDPNLHDFRLLELPGHVGDPQFLQSQRRILDLGCGPGTLVYRALGFGHDAWGIDLDEKKIALAHFRSRANNYPEGWASHILCADATKLPFEDQTFDVVSSCQVLEHIEELPQALFEAVRVTKRGGWLDLRAPDYRQSYDNHYSMTWPRFMPRGQAVRWAEAMGRPADGVGTFYYVTTPQVQAILEGLGCRMISVTLWQHMPDGPRKFDGRFGADPIFFRSDADVHALARQVKELELAGRLPDMYCRPLEFTIIAQRT